MATMQVADTKQRSATGDTAAVLARHLQAFGSGDIEALAADYADDALICTPDGAVRGLEQIRPFFTQIWQLFPPGKTTLELKQQIVEGETAYIAWSGASPAAEVPLGGDSFIVRGGKIVYQTFAGQIIPR